MNRASPTPSLSRFQQELEAAIARELAPAQRSRRRPRLGFGLGAAAAAAAVVAAVVVVTSSAGPEVQSAAAMTIKRAAQAVQAPPGAILHVDFTGTSSYSHGRSWHWRQDVWQQQVGSTCNYLTLEKDSPGTPAGTEGGSIDGREEVYDPIRNTIYVAPPVRIPPLPAGVHVPNGCSFMAGLAQQIRALLGSGKARVAGRATIDGKDAIKIVAGSTTYYVAADGTYAPIELSYGRRTDPLGMTVYFFHAYEQLPAAASGKVLSLTAQHPNARVRDGLAAFRAASNRLFPDG
jgi:hypothetical protein